MEKLLFLLTEIRRIFCCHDWVFVKRELIGCEFFAKKTCRFCKKETYVPYSSGNNLNNYDNS